MPTIQTYSEKSFVVRDADLYTEQITNLGGKYNPLLRDGPGWIFGNFKRDVVESFIKSIGGNVAPKGVLSGPTFIAVYIKISPFSRERPLPAHQIPPLFKSPP